MPRIPQNVIEEVFYLFKDREDASFGKNPGGTGFLVRFDTTFTGEVPGHYYCAITNWHVACQGGFSVIRLNTKDGGTDVIELGPQDWFFVSAGVDVAVVPVTIDESIHEVSFITNR